MCDFDVRSEDGKRIAKITKNNVVYVAPGYGHRDLPRESYVHHEDGTIIARVVETIMDHLTIAGEFWIEGHHVVITEDKIVSGGVTMTGNVISGLGKAIAIEPGQFSIGSR